MRYLRVAVQARDWTARLLQHNLRRSARSVLGPEVTRAFPLCSHTAGIPDGRQLVEMGIYVERKVA
jgi:hypothetical protein